MSMTTRLLVVAALALAPGALAQTMERDTDRSGSDYRDFDLRRAEPEACRAACERESACRAWTYVKPGVQGDLARCWLKDAVPEPGANDCCVSGVKGAGGGAGGGAGMERNTNRMGADYKDFELDQPRAQLCQAACTKERECRAWTYVKPGVQGDKAHCWLKNEVPEPGPDDCCTSGVKNARR